MYGGDVPAGAIDIDGPLLVLDAEFAANNAPPPIAWADAYQPGAAFNKIGRLTFNFPDQAPWQGHFAPLLPAQYDTRNGFLAIPLRPEYFWSNEAVAPYAGAYTNGAKHYSTSIVRLIAPISKFNLAGGQRHVHSDIDLSALWENIEEQGAVRYDSVITFANAIGGAAQPLRLRGLPVYHDDDTAYGGDAVAQQAVRNLYKFEYQLGNRYTINNNEWFVRNDNGNAQCFFREFCFQLLAPAECSNFARIRKIHEE